MATRFNMYKVSALPTTLEPNAMYLIPDANDSNAFVIHQVNATGSTSRIISGGNTATTVPLVPINSDVTLAAITQDVLLNSSLGTIDVELPLVASGVTISFFLHTAGNRVRIEPNAADATGILIGRNRLSFNREYDTVTLRALGGKWFVVS